MPEAALHPCELQRLRALHDLEVLDSEPEERFQRLVRLGKLVSTCPMAVISLVDEQRQWFKAREGLDVCETGREVSFCAHAIASDRELIVSDATQDARFADNPLVLNAPFLRSYAGIPIRDAATGLPLGTICVIDFEPRTFSEETLEALRDLAACAERELSNIELNQLSRQLAIEKERVEQADREKGDFLAFISHEIRTPLSAVMTLSDMLLQMSLGPREKRMLRSMRSSGEMMLVLINDILDFSKLEAHALELQPVPVKLADWIQTTAEPFALCAREKEVEIQTFLDPALPQWVQLDPLRFRQIASNLLNNALKFTSKGTIYLRLRQTGDGRLSLEVEDTGMGISEKGRKRLFQPYQQGDAGVYSRYGGTGLGLAICRRLAELMEGEISVESELGRGSRFYLLLPLVQTTEEPCSAVSREAAETAADTAAVPHDRPLSILLVDDHIINRKVIQYSLPAGEVDLAIAGSGVEALSAIKSGKSFDAVLLDLRLPDQSGFAVARSIREWEAAGKRAPLALIAHSGDVDQETRDRCREVGMNGFLSKPSPPAALKRILRIVREGALEDFVTAVL
jgi:signal transduction histidine kinase/CheY-like chemotaxis protein